MKSENFVIRKDRKAVTIHEDGFIDADEILKQKYPYILDAIEKEEYMAEETRGDYFKEILFEDKVVGFAVFENTPVGLMSLNQVYIMPEFRGNRLFLNEISSLYKRGIEICISQPTRNLVEILMHYGLAKKVSRNIAVSSIVFEIPTYCMAERTFVDPLMIYLSSFYALDICSTIIPEEISEDKCIILYHMELDWDDELYDVFDLREELINDEYFLNLRNQLLDNQEEFFRTIIELKEQLPVCENGYRSIIWSEDGLSDYMENMVDNGVLSEKRAFEIRTQLDYEYTHGMVTDEGILKRLYFLIDNDVPELSEVDFDALLESDQAICPHCYVTCSNTARFCHNCGYNLYYDVDDEDIDFEAAMPFIDILTEEDEDKQFAKFINMIIENKDFREEIFDSESEDEYKEFFDMIDDDPGLKELVMFSLSGEDYDEKEFLERFGDVIFANKDFQNFFEKYIYMEDEEQLPPPMDINKLTQDDLLRLMGRKYALNDSCPQCWDNQVFKILKFVKEYNNMEIPYIMDDSLNPALKDFLIREDYVSTEVTKETWNDFAQDLTVPQLKNILRENNLKVSGRKQELIDRLADGDINFND